MTNLPTGNYDGRGAVQITFVAGHFQEQINGWNTGSLGHNFALGDSIFIYQRLKFPTGSPNSVARIKQIIFGEDNDPNPDPNVQPRTIAYLLAPTSNLGSLDYQSNTYTGTTQTWHRPSDYGVTGMSSFTNNYWGLMIGKNIEGPQMCTAPPICLTTFDNSNRGFPSHTTSWAHGGATTASGAAATDGWYHIVFEVHSGTAGNAYVKHWCNSNDYSLPQGVSTPMQNILGANVAHPTEFVGGTENWGAGINVGGFVDQDTNNFSYILGGFGVATTFIDNWYPG